MLTLPAFGEIDYTDHIENERNRTLIIKDADTSDLVAYCALFEDNNYIKRESRNSDYSMFCAFDGDECVFLNYFKYTRELQIVTESECRYFLFADAAGEASVAPLVAQLHLEDFGMSYVIRLSDGRFIVIDGGNAFYPDADRLFETLTKYSTDEKPKIAAWIITHPHSDHYHCLFPFMERYSQRVHVERFMFNFPDHCDITHYPELPTRDTRFENDNSESTMIPRLYKLISELGTPVFTPHTGQCYKIGDAHFEVLACIDDTMGCSKSINATSLVLRMELGGQIVLFTADAGFGYASLAKRYKKHLKSDILQVPHHGFGSGPADAQIEGFEYISPDTCLLPVSDFNAYTSFCTYKEGTRYLMSDMGDFEMITGDSTHVLFMPYTPHKNGPRELERKFLQGLDNSGARTWIYSDLSTSRKEDFVFTLLNTTDVTLNVTVELFFENKSRNIREIKAELASGTVRTLCIIDKNEVDSESAYFNPVSLEKQGIPENALFAVRFICEEPIVVSHPDHTPAYHSSLFC